MPQTELINGHVERRYRCLNAGPVPKVASPAFACACSLYRWLSLDCPGSFLSLSVLVLSCSVMSDSLRPQAPLSIGLSQQECWSGLPFPPPEDLPDPDVEPATLVSPALAGRLPLAPPGKSKSYTSVVKKVKWHYHFR